MSKSRISQNLNTVWRDLMLAIGMLFMIMAMVAMLMINPIGKEIDEANITFKGSVVVEMYWPDAYASDVDMWVKAPGDIPVGYLSGHRNGKFFGYLRDDRGSIGDFTERNYEFSATRGRPLGEYIVNAHLYWFRTYLTAPSSGLPGSGNTSPIPSEDTLPMEVKFKVTMLDEAYERHLIAETTILLEKNKHQVTALRFTLKRDKTGAIVLDKNSVNSIFYDLRQEAGADAREDPHDYD